MSGEGRFAHCAGQCWKPVCVYIAAMRAIVYFSLHSFLSAQFIVLSSSCCTALLFTGPIIGLICCFRHCKETIGCAVMQGTPAQPKWPLALPRAAQDYAHCTPGIAALYPRTKRLS